MNSVQGLEKLPEIRLVRKYKSVCEINRHYVHGLYVLELGVTF